jgi:predicted esterase
MPVERAGPDAECTVATVQPGPGSREATFDFPRLPSIVDHRPDLVAWRNLRLDPGLHGLPFDRGRPLRVVLSEPGGDGWRLPVDEPTAGVLAWHPDRPLVAGLAMAGRRAYPWIADYERRTVREYPFHRAATSLTGLDPVARCPLAWCATGHLAFLIPAPAKDPAAPVDTEALVCEATGPAFVGLEPGVDRLATLAAASIAVLDITAGDARTVSDPLLVRRIAPASGGLAVSHSPLSGPADESGLSWTETVVTTGIERGFVSPPNRPPRPGPPRLQPVDDAVVRDVGEDGRPARLALFGDEGAVRSVVLWMRPAAGAPLPPAPFLPSTLDGVRNRVALLDLSLDWHDRITLQEVIGRIANTVRRSLEALQPLRPDAKVLTGGHSFGATVALRALAEVSELAGAIVHNGCYNRTLTPYGFQYERRTYWEIPELYHGLSALHFADRIDRPVLIVHGTEDANPATHPDQAVELYRAIVANGGPARLALFPCEGHNLRYRETHERLDGLQQDWLRRWES